MSLALALPVITAIVVARFTLPGMVAAPAQNATPLKTPDIEIPETLDQAKTMTKERIAHLKKLSQAQWDEERKTIAYRSPPEKIEDAVARAERRLSDLEAMLEANWPEEKAKLERRQKLLSAKGAD